MSKNYATDVGLEKILMCSQLQLLGLHKWPKRDSPVSSFRKFFESDSLFTFFTPLLGLWGNTAVGFSMQLHKE